MNHIKNPTAGAAIGAVDKELGRAKKHAVSLRERRFDGTLADGVYERARLRYTGIFRVVLEREFAKTPEEVAAEAKAKQGA